MSSQKVLKTESLFLGCFSTFKDLSEQEKIYYQTHPFFFLEDTMPSKKAGEITGDEDIIEIKKWLRKSIEEV